MADIEPPDHEIAPAVAPIVEPAPIRASADDTGAASTEALTEVTTEVPTVEHSSDAPVVPTSAPTVASSLSRLGKIYKTEEELELALLSMVDEGRSVRESSKLLGINRRTAYHILGRHEENIEAIRVATRKVLIAGALDRIDDWQVASEVGARKKGNHAPARDWLLHAGVIDSIEADRVGVRIAINIGTDEQPMRIISPLRRSADED